MVVIHLMNAAMLIFLTITILSFGWTIAGLANGSNSSAILTRFLMGVVFLIATAVAFIGAGTKFYVEPTESALLYNTSNGELVAISVSGLQNKNFFDEVIEFDATVQEIKFSPTGTELLAPIEVRDADQYTIKFSGTFKWQIDKSKTKDIYIKYKNLGGLQTTITQVIRPQFILTIENMGLDTQQLASVAQEEGSQTQGTMDRIQNRVLNDLNEALNVNYGVTIVEVLLDQPDLDDDYDALMQKINSAGETKDLNKREADANLAMQEGIRDQEAVANQAIIARAQAEADALLIRARAEADAAALQIQQFGSVTAYLEYLSITNLNDNVEIIFTEDGMIPVLKMTGTDSSVEVPIPVNDDAAQMPSLVTTPEGTTQVPAGQ